MKNFFVALALVAAAGSAFAAPAAKDKVANADKTDATLNNDTFKTGATTFVFSGANPGNGSTDGFKDAFKNTQDGTGGWTVLGNYDKAVSNQSLYFKAADATLTYGFALDAATDGKGSKSGTFTISSNKAVTLDLTLAVHASNASGSWLFDDLSLDANKAVTGTFKIEWTNNGGQVPGFSNFDLFARDLALKTVSPVGPVGPVSPVPEPDSAAMMVAALGVIGVIARRKKRA